MNILTGIVDVEVPAVFYKMDSESLGPDIFVQALRDICRTTLENGWEVSRWCGCEVHGSVIEGILNVRQPIYRDMHVIF